MQQNPNQVCVGGRLPALWLALFLVSCGLASQARAEPFQTDAAITDYFGALCVSGGAVQTSSCSYSGEDGLVSIVGSASATSNFTGLHARAEIEVVLLRDLYVGGYGGASARADLYDWIHIGLPGSGFVSLTVHTDGLASGPGYGFTQLDVGSVVGAGECYFYDSGTCTVHVPIQFNVDFFILHTLGAVVPITIGGPAGTMASGQALFGDTSVISSLSFTDESGKPLDLAYTSSAGMIYPSVPEPTTLTLLVAGLAGLCLARRRSQARN